MTYSIQSGALATEQLQQRLSQLDLTGLLQSAGAVGKLHVLLETPQLVVLFVPPAPGLHQFRPGPSANADAYGLPQAAGQDTPPRRHLTTRELDVLRLIAKGYKAPEVAGMLGLSAHTVRGYVREVYRKLGISSRAEATLEALQRGLVR
jgi:DNA-binding CsgD family transcriptional regulator